MLVNAAAVHHQRRNSVENMLKKSVVAIAATGLVGGLLLAVLLITPPTKAADQSTESLYGHKCAVCHGKDGLGNTAKGKKVHVKDVHANMKDSEADMIKIVTKGKGKDMDGYEKEFSKEQIEALVDYYRGLGK
ncbi:MAG TPA: c-type cytochrome [Terriglobia bacterium]|nr:c-type cytochrome [Terriglobia bacterium]